MLTDFSDLLGKTLVKITVDNLETWMDNELGTVLKFETIDGDVYEMYHYQSCCESVWLEDTAGDLDDLLHQPILQAEKVTEDLPSSYGIKGYTFYKLATIKGSVTLRWCGESNGYYSIDVSFSKLERTTP